MKKIALINALAMLIFTIAPMMMGVKKVEAANFSYVVVRPDRHAISVATQYLIIVRPVTTGTEASTKVTFPTGYDVSGAAGTFTGVPTTYDGHTLTNPTISGTSISGQNVTVAHGDLVVGTYYGFYLTSVTNDDSVGHQEFTIATQTSGPATIDTSDVATYLVTDNGGSTDADQIVVTANVDPTYTIALGSNSQTIDAALGSVVSGSGVSITVTTNAQGGTAQFMKAGASTGLTSATTGTSIAFAGTAADGNPTTISAGTEGVVVDIDETTDTSTTLTVAAEFNGATTVAGGTPSTSFQQIFSSTAPVGGAGDVATFIPRVAIAATTKAADDYTQTFTIVGAGNF